MNTHTIFSIYISDYYQHKLYIIIAARKLREIMRRLWVSYELVSFIQHPPLVLREEERRKINANFIYFCMLWNELINAVQLNYFTIQYKIKSVKNENKKYNPRIMNSCRVVNISFNILIREKEVVDHQPCVCFQEMEN